MSDFKRGDRVRWQYDHALNSRSYVTWEKTGTFIAKVKHRHLYMGKPKAVVLFDKNKRASRVPISELKEVKS